MNNHRRIFDMRSARARPSRPARATSYHAGVARRRRVLQCAFAPWLAREPTLASWAAVTAPAHTHKGIVDAPPRGVAA